MKVTDWSQFKFFTEKEMSCKQTGECEMDSDFMIRLEAVREEFGKPMRITSAYRSVLHSEERNKAKPGTHAHGIAVDVALMGADAYELVAIALRHGFTGIGVSQREGKGRYIHLDTGSRKAIWSY